MKDVFENKYKEDVLSEMTFYNEGALDVAGEVNDTSMANLVDILDKHSGIENLSFQKPGNQPATDFLGFFGFTKNPFSDALNPDFFYKTKFHEQTYKRMKLAVDQDISLTLITGTSGTGKSLLSQMLLKELQSPQYKTILILATPGMTKSSLLKEILTEAEVDTEGTHSTQALIKILTSYLIDLYQHKKKLVILVDESHLLSSSSLHTLRTLSNIEVPERKLLTCLLFAEPRFLKRLSHPSYQSLKSRMYLQSELLPLDAPDCFQYVKYRLMISGANPDLFDYKSLAAIHYCSGGVCRQVNKLCALVLMESFLKESKKIDSGFILECAKML